LADANSIDEHERLAALRTSGPVRTALVTEDVLDCAEIADCIAEEVAGIALGAGHVGEAGVAARKYLRAGLAGDVEGVDDEEVVVLAGGAELGIGA
jgi:hypothetical protein